MFDAFEDYGMDDDDDEDDFISYFFHFSSCPTFCLNSLNLADILLGAVYSRRNKRGGDAGAVGVPGGG